MPKKIVLKTAQSDASVSDYLDAIESQQARKEANTLVDLFERVTGVKGRMWGTSIVGFGEYIYYRANGDEGKYMVCGFSMRKSGPTIYIMPGYQDYTEILQQLGPHKLGKSCLYLKSLEGINQQILAQLIQRGLEDLKKTHAVTLE